MWEAKRLGLLYFLVIRSMWIQVGIWHFFGGVFGHPIPYESAWPSRWLNNVDKSRLPHVDELYFASLE